mmetsp:Transcript_13175/g.21387  ORF Transcript_13175/g.21387 Transcript_13175/m.21387 type:complete len:333 (-) Transcript_13175:2034-3032(-)
MVPTQSDDGQNLVTFSEIRKCAPSENQQDNEKNQATSSVENTTGETLPVSRTNLVLGEEKSQQLPNLFAGMTPLKPQNDPNKPPQTTSQPGPFQVPMMSMPMFPLNPQLAGQPMIHPSQDVSQPQLAQYMQNFQQPGQPQFIRAFPQQFMPQTQHPPGVPGQPQLFVPQNSGQSQQNQQQQMVFVYNQMPNNIYHAGGCGMIAPQYTTIPMQHVPTPQNCPGPVPQNAPPDMQQKRVAQASVTVHPKRRRRRAKTWSSKYRGVSWHKRDKRWVARAWIQGKTENLGTYTKEEHAALAVDEKIIQIFGEDHSPQSLNFPDPEERERLRNDRDV